MLCRNVNIESETESCGTPFGWACVWAFNLNAGIGNLSDQKFMFDLDEYEKSLLKKYIEEQC